MTNFLVEKGYWDYIKGEHEIALVVSKENATHEQIKALKDQNQGSWKVMYWLSISIKYTMIGHIQDANSPKEAWDNLAKFNVNNTRVQKIQLNSELNTIK